MSKQKHVIEVTPPEYQQVRENYSFSNYGCPVCHGRGHFSPRKVGHDEWSAKMCDYCEGAGKVKAEVTIKWSADLD